VDKPAGPSSFAVVRQIRQRLGGKVGHAGTLDPLASGLLVVLVGPATRLARYLVGLDKRYVTEVELGLRTTTGDAEGDELERPPVPDDLAAAVAELTGEVELPVPAASAVKVGGERAYRLHRRGVAVEMPVRLSQVHSIDVLRYDPPVAQLRLHVGSGTYVRAIADALGGHCRALRRVAVGPFGIEQADDERLLPPRERRGDGRARLTYDDRLVAVARLSGGLARPETVVMKPGGEG
jgi:tRNA pseudouridine55 synthase